MNKRWMKSMLAGALVALAMGGVAFADMPGTQYGRLVSNSGVVAKGDLTYVAYVNGNDDVIHTENAYNCALGLGQGHLVQNGDSLYLLNFANFANAQPGQSFNVIFTTKAGQRGSTSGVVPPGLTESANPVQLANAAVPATPNNLQVARSSNGTSLTWNAEAGLTYRIYRADLPSGAGNTASRGIYNKVAENVAAGTFVDTTADKSITSWYLIVAQDKNGVVSAHSDEIRALPATQLMDNHQIQKPNMVAPKSGLKTQDKITK